MGIVYVSIKPGGESFQSFLRDAKLEKILNSHIYGSI